jgi:hypothetical protein
MRAATAFLSLCLCVGTAVAQLIPQNLNPSERDRQFKSDQEQSLSLSRWFESQRTRPLSEPEKAVRAVQDAVARGDCAGAVSALNAGLAKAYPQVWMLAGAMYEDGICLKANWDRAVSFYQRADAAGHAGAAQRLAAGYASPVGGRDLAAALWWAARARTALPSPCAQVVPLADDADRFIAALKAWPAGQLGACAYAAAVMSSVQGELVAPDLAAAYGLQGTVRLSYVPDQARLDIIDDLKLTSTAVQDALAQKADERAARAALTQQLRQAADRAFKRYDKPAGIPPAWHVEAEQMLLRPQ